MAITPGSRCWIFDTTCSTVWPRARARGTCTPKVAMPRDFRYAANASIPKPNCLSSRQGLRFSKLTGGCTQQTGRINHLIAMSENSQTFLQKRPAGIRERVLLSAEDWVVGVAPRAPLNFQAEIVEIGVMTHLQLVAPFQTDRKS